MVSAFPSIVDVNFTATMETLLDGVAEGTVEWKSIIRNFYPDLKEAVEHAEQALEKIEIEDEVTDTICENCGRNMDLMENFWHARDFRNAVIPNRILKKLA